MISSLPLAVPLLLLATALLGALATGRRPWAFAAWLVPLPALLVLDRATLAVVVPSLVLAFMLADLWRNSGVLPLPRSAALAMVAGSSLFAVLPFVAHHFLAPSLPAVLAPLVLPSVLVLLEHGGVRSSPFGTWGASAYTQRRNLPLVQFVSVAGLSGITFFVTWPATALASGLQRGLDQQDTRLGLAAAVVAVAAIHVAGGVRLARRRHRPSRRLTIAVVSRPSDLAGAAQLEQLLTADLSDPAVAAEASTTFRTLHDQLVSATETAAAEGAVLAVWPEADAPTLAADERILVDRIRETAKRHEIHILAGLVTIEPLLSHPLDNHVVLIDPSGDVRAIYRKAKLVPGIETRLSKPGDRPIPMIDTDIGRIAAAICFDLDFPDHISTAGEHRADLLLAAASDWPAIDRLHADMAALRAVENGVTLVRAARWGRSEIVDPYGRTLAWADHVDGAGTTLSATVPVVQTSTAHHRLHAIVPRLAVAILLAAGAAWAVSTLGA